MTRETDHEERIRERAHGIWERDGRPHGCDVAHWVQAEREIAQEAKAAAPVGAGKPEPAKPTQTRPRRKGAAEGTAAGRQTSVR